MRSEVCATAYRRVESKGTQLLSPGPAGAMKIRPSGVSSCNRLQETLKAGFSGGCWTALASKLFVFYACRHARHRHRRDFAQGPCNICRVGLAVWSFWWLPSHRQSNGQPDRQTRARGKNFQAGPALASGGIVGLKTCFRVPEVLELGMLTCKPRASRSTSRDAWSILDSIQQCRCLEAVAGCPRLLLPSAMHRCTEVWTLTLRASAF